MITIKELCGGKLENERERLKFEAVCNYEDCCVFEIKVHKVQGDQRGRWQIEERLGGH